MDIGTIIIVIIAGIFLFSVFSMRRKPNSNAPGEPPPPPPSGDQPRSNSFFGGGKGYGKWIGGGLGWAFGGPLGAILGFALGSMFEGGNRNPYQGTPRGDFAMSLLVLSAAVMKADQKVLKSELDYVRSFFVRQFGEEEGNRFVIMLKEILKQDINIREVSIQVGQYMEPPIRLQLLHYLFGIASADNTYHPDEVAVIEQISGFMGISHADYQSVRAMFIKDTNWAYDVLEITKEASNDEVKKAYREMAKKHHPDKVGQLGEDIKRAATEKFQKINAAYEEIKRQRGMV